MALDYGWEKLHEAIISLSGSSDIKTRLSSAISRLTRLEAPRDLPEEIREEFVEFMTKVTSIEATGDEGKIMATLNTLDETELVELAHNIESFLASSTNPKYRSIVFKIHSEEAS